MTKVTTTETNAPTNNAQTGLLLSHCVLSFSGPDAATFLQGYLTCDTALLEPSVAAPAAFTDLKGRVVANGWVWGTTEQIEMLLARSLAEPVADFLRPYMNFSKTKLSIGEAAPLATLASSAAATSAANTATATSAERIAVGQSRALLDSQGASRNDDTWPDISTPWLSECIARREAVVTAATSHGYLPQMLGLTDLGAVSFEKGCYLGQEVVARAEHRGEVKRRLRFVTYRGDGTLKANDVLADDKGKRMANVICAVPGTALVVSSVAATGTTERWLVEETPYSIELD